MQKNRDEEGRHSTVPTEDIEELDHLPQIQFSTTAYAILEHEGKLDVKIKRTGPTDVDIRFRCLNLLAHALIHAYAMMQCNTS